MLWALYHVWRLHVNAAVTMAMLVAMCARHVCTLIHLPSLLFTSVYHFIPIKMIMNCGTEIIVAVLLIALGVLIVGLHVRTARMLSAISQSQDKDLESGIINEPTPPQQGPLNKGLSDPRFPASRMLSSRSKIWKTRTERDRVARSKVTF